MGATFCHLAALRSAIEFLFWDHWETAVLGQILAGRSRERISAIWRPLGRRLNFSSGIIRVFFTGSNGRFGRVTHEGCVLSTRPYRPSLLGSLGNGRFGPNPGRELTGGHGGHGRLREVTGTEGENGGKWRNGRKKVLVGDNQRKWRKCQV